MVRDVRKYKTVFRRESVYIEDPSTRDYTKFSHGTGEQKLKNLLGKIRNSVMRCYSVSNFFREIAS